MSITGWKEPLMSDTRALGVGAATCDDKDCEVCQDLREKTKKEK